MSDNRISTEVVKAEVQLIEVRLLAKQEKK